ncbi:MAG: hypothetical protein IKS36_02900, partial [Bacteroidales bacterium]|nr:hypothetical protein [Bacteroidales bacterium]
LSASEGGRNPTIFPKAGAKLRQKILPAKFSCYFFINQAKIFRFLYKSVLKNSLIPYNNI